MVSLARFRLTRRRRTPETPPPAPWAADEGRDRVVTYICLFGGGLPGTALRMSRRADFACFELLGPKVRAALNGSMTVTCNYSSADIMDEFRRRRQNAKNPDHDEKMAADVVRLDKQIWGKS